MAADPPPALSLLDRLLDDASGEADGREDADGAERRLKLGLRRDLEGLLNAKRPHSGWLSRGDGLEQTVVGFGLPDLSTDDFSSPAVRERIRRLIAAAIRTFEPRLARVEVEAGDEVTSAGVRFRISAVLRYDLAAEPVVYDARLRPTDREFAVRLAR